VRRQPQSKVHRKSRHNIQLPARSYIKLNITMWIQNLAASDPTRTTSRVKEKKRERVQYNK
jgi:hypothetical protein